MKGKLQENISLEGSKKSIVAGVMVFIMLFSTQMYSFQDFDNKSNLDDEHENPNNTLFQHSSLPSEEPNGQELQEQQNMNFFDHPMYSDIFYNDPASYYGKISDPSALALNPNYEFYSFQLVIIVRVCLSFLGV